MIKCMESGEPYLLLKGGLAEVYKGPKDAFGKVHLFCEGSSEKVCQLIEGSSKENRNPIKASVAEACRPLEKDHGEVRHSLEDGSREIYRCIEFESCKVRSTFGEDNATKIVISVHELAL